MRSTRLIKPTTPKSNTNGVFLKNNLSIYSNYSFMLKLQTKSDRIMKIKFKKLLSAFALLNLISATVYALPPNTEDLRAQGQFDNVTTIKRNLAKSVAVNYHTLDAHLKQQLSTYQLSLNVEKLPALGMQKQHDLNAANSSLLQLKGLPANTGSLMQVRLASENMLDRWQQGDAPLFAFAPSGDDKNWSEIEAFDQFGNIHYLSVDDMPEQPVFVIELDQQKVHHAGLNVMKQVFSSANTQKTSAVSVNQTQQTQNNDQPISTSILKYIHLNDDKEPWILGAAEIYAIVTGVNPTRDEPILDIVDMPYLDYDKTDYYPNQIIVHWQRYRWQAVDLLLMEQDDNTNYKTLAIKLLEISAEVLSSIPDIQAQGYAIIPRLTNELIRAMPDHWFVNNDDYVDVFYTLLENQEYTLYKGASANATITLVPLVIDPR